ncbi:MAG TPA: MFS transporter, partial [Gammaproteobacteria bacterium]|nr:MFS transporter [Gammaproteobacteria bacterium]
AGLGWRLMFFVLGFLGVIWAFAWFIIFRDNPSRSKHVSAYELDHIKKRPHVTSEAALAHDEQTTSWKFILFNKSFLVNNYAFFAFGYLLFFSINWLPGYLQQTYGFEVKKAGWFLLGPWTTATVLVVIGGIISDRLWRKTHSIRIARSHLIWICQVLSVISFIPVILSHSLIVSMIGLSLGVGFGMMPNAAFYAINADLAHDRAATSLGVMTCASSFSAILAPFLTGLLSSWTGDFSIAILLMMGLMLSSALMIILFQHPDRVLAKKWEKKAIHLTN